MCHDQILQPGTIGTGERSSLAESEVDAKGWQSTVGGDLCCQLSRGGNDVDQGVVGFDDVERLRHPHATTCESAVENADAAHDPQ